MPYLTEHLNLRSFLAGLFLALIGAVCFALIILAQNDTQALIAHNRAAQEQEIADTLLPPEVFGSDLQMDCYLISDPRIGQNMKLYAAREGDQIKGYILQYSTARGYSNPLVMISSFNADKSLYRADIQFSRETPGIGDKLDRRHGTFLDALSGKNLKNVKWDVKKFGGDFDYVTGATVTSRALILASRDALQVLSEADLNRLKKCRVKR
ncbi:MAG: RnfABCDGE type electron transport complex subunit G [Proteobacteria bacterium]|uniref:RnfABCDGE type electron transport complex subunit G n=1 Tax=Candidatus Avisuccinivibrio stercorigallinarum TaxID=2840704 RepID=A0A9D9DCT6_9GAMM|nr:RnfABCDGE type electron transport complex subunit G [Candidatus Avisuccinivibrio stercorigallinarum]